jgi:glycyl-tRNA synthetase
MSDKRPTLDELVSLAKRRGFVFPSSEIYGGLAGFYDYGPYGSQMVKNIKDAWWESFVRAVPNVYGIDTSIIQNPKLWEASGHVDGFNDPLVECLNCKARHKGDSLKETNICPNCGKKDTLSEPTQFNMMMKTYLGSSAKSEMLAYLRPETAGGMYTNFELVAKLVKPLETK